jgi:uncharacterized protein YceH (UPF0502 family)
MHLFCGESFVPETNPESGPSAGASWAENDARLFLLEEQVAALRHEVAELRELIHSLTQ